MGVLPFAVAFFVVLVSSASVSASVAAVSCFFGRPLALTAVLAGAAFFGAAAAFLVTFAFVSGAGFGATLAFVFAAGVLVIFALVLAAGLGDSASVAASACREDVRVGCAFAAFFGAMLGGDAVARFLMNLTPATLWCGCWLARCVRASRRCWVQLVQFCVGWFWFASVEVDVPACQITRSSKRSRGIKKGSALRLK